MKDRIEKFKDDRIGGKKRVFVETVATEEMKPEDHDAMDVTEG